MFPCDDQEDKIMMEDEMMEDEMMEKDDIMMEKKPMMITENKYGS